MYYAHESLLSRRHRKAGSPICAVWLPPPCTKLHSKSSAGGRQRRRRRRAQRLIITNAFMYMPSQILVHTTANTSLRHTAYYNSMHVCRYMNMYEHLMLCVHYIHMEFAGPGFRATCSLCMPTIREILHRKSCNAFTIIYCGPVSKSFKRVAFWPTRFDVN